MIPTLMFDIVMAYIVMALGDDSNSHVRYSYGLYSYGPRRRFQLSCFDPTKKIQRHRTITSPCVLQDKCLCAPFAARASYNFQARRARIQALLHRRCSRPQAEAVLQGGCGRAAWPCSSRLLLFQVWASLSAPISPMCRPTSAVFPSRLSL